MSDNWRGIFFGDLCLFMIINNITHYVFAFVFKFMNE